MGLSDLKMLFSLSLRGAKLFYTMVQVFLMRLNPKYAIEILLLIQTAANQSFY